MESAGEVDAVRTRSRVYRGALRRLPSPARQLVEGTEASLRGTPGLVRHVDLAAALLRRRRRSDRLLVGWVLNADENDGATRVRGLMPHAYLRSRGVISVILRKPRWAYVPLELTSCDIDRISRARFDVVVLQGVVGPGAEALVTALRAARTKTVFTVGDLVESSLPGLVDRIVVASKRLAPVAAGYEDRLEVIEAAVDAPPGLVKDYDGAPRCSPVTVAWVGYPENLHLLDPVREALNDRRLRDYRLVTISRGADATYQWDRKRVYEHLMESDIAVLPSADTDWYSAKPNTRMTMLKALGLPIVASPVDSYLETLRHGVSCYFARTVDEWIECLAALRDPDLRRQIGLADRERVLARYGFEAIGARWLALIEALAAQRQPASAADALIRS